MRILYFHQHFTTPSGAGGTRSYEFARALVERGHRVTMVCGQGRYNGLTLVWDSARGWHRSVVDGIEVIALPLAYSNHDSIARRCWVFLRFAWRSVAIALERDYDLLFATSTPLTAALPGIAMKLAGRGRPFVFEVRDLWPELPRALGMTNSVLLVGMSLLEYLGYRAADSCIGLSPGIVKGIQRRSRENQPVAMIPNGCDLSLFAPSKRRRLEISGVERGDFVAGFTGTHGVANGLDAVLDAARELKRRGVRRIKLVLVGDGSQKQRLMERARREQLDNCVFLPPAKKLELAPLTAGLDCGLQILANVPAFYFGTSPNKFFDYIAAGVPVLCNYPGWLADLITHHRCGLAVPPGDPTAFAEALCRLADGGEDAATMGCNARALAESQFSRADLAARFAEVVEKSAPAGESAAVQLL